MLRPSVALLALAAAATTALAGCGGSTTAPPPPVLPSPTASARPAAPVLFGGAGSAFTTRLAPDAALAARGADAVARLARQAAYVKGGSPVAGYYPAGFGTRMLMGDYSVPVYEVPAAQPTTRVTWIDEQGKAVYPGVDSNLQGTFDHVPLPLDVAQLQAAGNDGHLVVWQPSSDTMWEFWRFATAGTAGTAGRTFTAHYGAEIPHVSTSTGRLPNTWGARATSLALLGGVVRMQEYVDGVVPHAIAISLPVVAKDIVAPAARGDGPGAAVAAGAGAAAADDAIPEGAAFRLPAGFDCAPSAAYARLLGELCAAARDYGLLVVDRTGGTVSAYLEDDRSVGTAYSAVRSSPWPAVTGLLGGPAGVLEHFPWAQLQELSPATSGT